MITFTNEKRASPVRELARAIDSVRWATAVYLLLPPRHSRRALSRSGASSAVSDSFVANNRPIVLLAKLDRQLTQLSVSLGSVGGEGLLDAVTKVHKRDAEKAKQLMNGVAREFNVLGGRMKGAGCVIDRSPKNLESK